MIKKPLKNHQKERLSAAITAISNPIFSTLIISHLRKCVSGFFIAYGNFDYQDKLEFDGIEKKPIYGYAYVQAFLDNETGTPKMEPGRCRLVKQNLPDELEVFLESFPFLKKKGLDRNHLYFYWNLDYPNNIDGFEADYNDAYKLKYSGMLKALKNDIG